jgi:transglutaminase-like putative cysteine protease
LRVESRVTVEQFNTNPFDFVLDPEAMHLPFLYRREELPDLLPYLQRDHPADEEVLRNWLRPFLKPGGGAVTLDFLTALNQSIPLAFTYTRREEPGVQSPGETLRRRAGSCRDFALLFMEAARHLGLAARFASGYLCESGNARFDAASGATHAWAEIYLPGAGWKGFDPTCGLLAADHHVRVAVVRDPRQATPIRGAFTGPASAFLGIEVIVKARAITAPS